MLKRIYTRSYINSLKYDHRHFYDDLDEYGNQDSDTAFYFIPGINGTAGQIRFAIPNLIGKFGKDIFIKSCFLEEFSSKALIWDKYKLSNVLKKREKIVFDLNKMAQKNRRLYIVASSSGFYDFLYAYGSLSEKVRDKSELLWVAVAPPEFRKGVFTELFYRINGFRVDGYRWFAYPNSNLLRIINPETSTHHIWKQGKVKKRFYKTDLESRFKCFGIYWAYTSIDCFNYLLRVMIDNSSYPIDMKSYVMVATRDGYWQGKSTAEINRVLDGFISNREMLFRPTSHLWLVSPDNMSDLLDLIRG